MAKKSKKRKGTIEVRRAHIALGQVDDPDVAATSCELDAAADRRWFLAHPGETERVRAPSPLERAAFGLPEGTEVVVKRLKSGTQMRTFFSPPRLSALPRPERT